MKLPLSWLREHLETDADTAAIAAKLTAIGLEVEEVHDPASVLGDFVVGYVVDAAKHPDADRLRVLSVDPGDGKPLTVVCGAPNARAGMKGILARPGARIPATGDTLKKGKIRGVESQGMMCSARELGLGEEHDGILDLDTDLPAGASAAAALAADAVIIIAVTPNRGDALGVRGVARDLAAAGLGALKPVDKTTVVGTFDQPLSVSIVSDAQQACPMFATRLIRGVRNGESPAWLKRKLEAVGLRSISALVDITNLLLMDRGRPLHVFDAGKLAGDVSIRFAKDGETLAALDERTYTLDTESLVIADANGPQSLGGIMGGAASGCTEATTDVLLEAAHFDPITIARTGRALGIDSDSRYRFERWVDPASVLPGMEAATRLILELCGGEASHVAVAGGLPPGPESIAYNPSLVARMTGMDVAVDPQAAVLRALGCAVVQEGDILAVTPPSSRRDLTGPHDLVEEVARLVGYDALPATPLPPRGPLPKPALSPAQRRAEAVRRGLAARGMTEALTWSFMDRGLAALVGDVDESMVLANPIARNLSTLRPSILANLLSGAARNGAHGRPDVALFEVGSVFTGGRPGDQALVAAGVRIGRTGPRHWTHEARDVDVFDAKADALAVLEAAQAPVANVQVTADPPRWFHPGRAGVLRLGGTVLAAFGVLHPSVCAALDVRGPAVGFEVRLDALPLPRRKASRAKPALPAITLQKVTRDLALVVAEDVPTADVVRALRGADKKLIEDVALFDVYRGNTIPAGTKSLALTVTLQPTETTLTDADIQAVMDKVVAAAQAASGARIRA